MKKLIFAFIFIFTASSFAGDQGLRKTAGTGVDEYQSDACGALNRIRYEDGGKVVKLLIENINIKFNKKDISYDAAVLANALTDKKIKVCYYTKGANSHAMLDFYSDETAK